MTWLPIAQVATFFGSLLLTLVFIYLYKQEHERYLLLWTVGWGVYTLNFGLSLLLQTLQVHFLVILVSITIQIFYLSNSILLLRGSCLLRPCSWKPNWLYIGLLPAVWAVVFVILGASYPVYAGPIYIFNVIAYGLAGINILKVENSSRLIKGIAGYGLILWAVHQVDFIFLSSVEWFAPWGFLISALLEFVVAIATVLVFFEGKRAELHQREQELAKLNLELESKVAERTTQLEDVLHEMESFSYSVSHDLRAPVRAVIGFSQILEDEYGDELPDDARVYLDYITKNSLRMEHLIQDLLKLSRIGRQGLEIEIINLSEIAQCAFEDLLQSFDAPDKVCFVAQPTQDVAADQNMIRLLFDNLISNALKFSHNNDRIEIEFGGKDTDQGYEYYIKDNGIGFSMEYADKLFAVFQRLHSSEDYEGTGVGLATVKRIVNCHNGKVWAESQPGNGAVFHFKLNTQN